MSGFKYKNFTTLPIEQEGEVFSTKVVNSSEYITLTGKDMEELKARFEHAIDKHLKRCEELGIDPYEGGGNNV